MSKSTTDNDPSNASIMLTHLEIHQMSRRTNNVTLNLDTLCSANSEREAAPSESELSACAGFLGKPASKKLRRKADVLFLQFVELLHGRTNDAEAFETLIDFIGSCNMALEEATAENKPESVQWLVQESKTWKLLHALYKDRVVLQSGVNTDMEVPSLDASDKEIVGHLFTSNSTIREYQTVVDWLEACYEKNESGPHVCHSADSAKAWENTLFQLKKRKQIAFSGPGEIVASLDPDAPAREGRSLHSLDAEDNARLSKCMFEELRQGHVEKAIALCKYCGQTWRAAVLEGWALHEDPNRRQTDGYANKCEKESILGNKRRALWKKCAWALAESKNLDEFARGVIAIFCGHLEALKSLLSKSWEDLLWAYLKVQIDIRVESEIRLYWKSKKAPPSMPEEYWNAKMSLEQIFEELSAHSDASVRDSANSKIAIVQKYLILDDIGELLTQIQTWIENANENRDSEARSPHVLRFLSHLVLFMRQIGRITHHDAADCIIAAYVDRLIEFGEPHLVAFYTSALSTKLQIEKYSKFLEGVRTTSERQKALEEAVSARLDIESITKYTVEMIRLRLPTGTESITNTFNRSGSDGRYALEMGEVTELDEEKISALEWLTFLPSQRYELLWQANAMIRSFLAENKSQCLLKVYKMVATEAISEYMDVKDPSGGDYREFCIVKEFLSYKVYSLATNYFSEWIELYNKRPKKAIIATKNEKFSERFALEQKEEQFNVETSLWEKQINEKFDVTMTALCNVLQYPAWGWLTDPHMPKEFEKDCDLEWKNRILQKEKIRSIVVPEIIMIMQRMCDLKCDHKGCLKLATTVADNKYRLYKVFTRQEIADLLKKLTLSAVKLMSSQKDPFGFSDAF